jgi:hypothetical protein
MTRFDAGRWPYHVRLSDLSTNSFVSADIRADFTEPRRQAGATDRPRTKPNLGFCEINRKQIPAHISTMGRTGPEGESDMNAAITWLLPRASAKSIDDIESFISIALFCGVGLLLSLSVLIADQYIPGEWF